MRKEALESSPDLLIKMLKKALEFNIPARHVLFDCWFGYPATIVMIRYMILASEKRCHEDVRSLGDLFFLAYDEVADIRFDQAIVLLLELLINCLNEYLDLTDEQIDQFMHAFIHQLPERFKRHLVLKSA